jgi:hypothetical protein
MERVKEGEGVPHDISLLPGHSSLTSADIEYGHLDWRQGYRYYAVVVWRQGGEHIQYSVNYFPYAKEAGTIKVEKGPVR